jgi:hypothetical protein
MRTFLQVTVLCAAGVANHEAAALWFGPACREWQGRFGAPSFLDTAHMRQRQGLETHQHVDCLWFVLLNAIHRFRNPFTACLVTSEVNIFLLSTYMSPAVGTVQNHARLRGTLHNRVDEHRMIKILPIILD